jgi:hypothetical protein
MTLSARSVFSVAVASLLCAGLVVANRGWAEGRQKADSDAAVERAREQIRMLDDIHKTAVVAITDKYVHKETDTAAATVAGALFGVMKQKGWYESRLIDASGAPYNDKNVAVDDFEKAAVQALIGGKDYYEQLITVNGKARLRAATPVPVVMKKCTMCHDNYNDVKQGAPIGVLTYNVPVK